MSWQTAEFRSQKLECVSERQDRIAGYSTAALREQSVLVVGGGGLGYNIVTGMVRKGVGRVVICDSDQVELTNLNRQGFFPADLEQPKAICLARNAAREGALGSKVVGQVTDFTPDTAEHLAEGAQLVICAVDNDLARKHASNLCAKKGIPGIFCAVNETADHGWVFVQEPDGACLACVFPRVAAATNDRERCAASPAVIDILRAVGALVLYACDSLVLPARVRLWNYRTVNLRGGAQDEIVIVKRRDKCPMCI